MNQYFTNNNRILLTTQDLSYAASSTGVVTYGEIHKADLRKITECPDKNTAALILLAQTHMPKTKSRYKSKKELKAALQMTASDAAVAHQECVDIQQSTVAPAQTAYPYLYTTNMKRIVLSQRSLSYAADLRNPDMLHEEDIREEDWPHLCCLLNTRLALFLQKYTEGHFCNANTQIDLTHNPTNYHHNRVYMIQEDGHPECILRDGTQLLSVPELTLPKNETESAVLRLYLSAAEHQLAVCRIYLALAKEAAAS